MQPLIFWLGCWAAWLEPWCGSAVPRDEPEIARVKAAAGNLCLARHTAVSHRR